MTRLANKVALVTGGSRGIGAAIAKRLAAEGASVASTYARDEAAATAVVEWIRNNGGRSIAIQADAADNAAVMRAVSQTAATLGGIDVLVNKAGTAIPKTFEETTAEEMDRVIAINLRGTLSATQEALKHMKDGGRVIMIGSSVSERVLTPGLVAYSATKGAVKMFAQSLAREVGSRGITVNNIEPGPIDTDLNPATGDWAVPQKAVTALNRYGTVEEVAALVALSPAGVFLHYRSEPCCRWWKPTRKPNQAVEEAIEGAYLHRAFLVHLGESAARDQPVNQSRPRAGGIVLPDGDQAKNAGRPPSLLINHLQRLLAPSPGPPWHIPGTPNLSWSRSRHNAYVADSWLLRNDLTILPNIEACHTCTRSSGRSFAARRRVRPRRRRSCVFARLWSVLSLS